MYFVIVHIRKKCSEPIEYSRRSHFCMAKMFRSYRFYGTTWFLYGKNVQIL